MSKYIKYYFRPNILTEGIFSFNKNVDLLNIQKNR